MTVKIRVAILGATGESGGLILNGLLESKDPEFQVTALARAASADKPEYAQLSQRGVNVSVADLDGPEEELSKILEGIDVVIATVPPNVLQSQLPLARAAKRAGVKRFVPSSYAMAIAPNGISTAQNKKEEVYLELGRIGIPYTIIDVGWWHFGFIPRLPLGSTDYAIAVPEFLVNLIPGDGNVKTCLVDNQDVGSLVARIIADERTINKRIMANGDALSLNEMFDIAERLTGGVPERRYIDAAGLDSMIQDMRTKIAADQNDYPTLVGCFWLEYYYSSFIDKDNSPEGIKRLGYVPVSELYPDLRTTSFGTFFKDILEHKRSLPYANRRTA
ncbi:hypothetical protein ACHAPT_006486 [Fusarium lateritium]